MAGMIDKDECINELLHTDTEGEMLGNVRKVVCIHIGEIMPLRTVPTGTGNRRAPDRLIGRTPWHC